MRVFVAGATGVLGRRLVVRLRDQGHEVVGLSRGPGNEATIRALGGEPRAADLFDVDSLVRAAEGSDVVVHAATKIPASARPRASEWAENDRIRRDGVRALSEAAGRIGARGYVQQSIVWAARPSDDGPFDEDSPLNGSGPFASAVDAERIAREAGGRNGFAVAVLRGAMFYSADSGQVRLLAEGLVRRRMPIFGRGDGVWSLIHADDMAAAVATAVTSLADGVWHVCDDVPATTGDLLREIARRLGAPEPRSVPLWLARLVAGRDVVDFFRRSTRTSNAKIRRDLHWSPRFPSYTEGLDGVVRAWDAEGFPTR